MQMLILDVTPLIHPVRLVLPAHLMPVALQQYRKAMAL
jgi:hypothetical protein